MKSVYQSANILKEKMKRSHSDNVVTSPPQKKQCFTTVDEFEDNQNGKKIIPSYIAYNNNDIFPTAKHPPFTYLHVISLCVPRVHNRENDFKPYVATNVREDKSIDLVYTCCPKIRAKLIASPMYLGVHRKTRDEMQKLVFQCTTTGCEIFLYERPTINRLTLKYELILWFAFRDLWSFHYRADHNTVRMYPVKISSDGSIQPLVLAGVYPKFDLTHYFPYNHHDASFQTKCLKTLVSRIIVTALHDDESLYEGIFSRVRFGNKYNCSIQDTGVSFEVVKHSAVAVIPSLNSFMLNFVESYFVGQNLKHIPKGYFYSKTSGHFHSTETKFLSTPELEYYQPGDI